jgi:hypothetical protein
MEGLGLIPGRNRDLSFRRKPPIQWVGRVRRRHHCFLQSFVLEAQTNNTSIMDSILCTFKCSIFPVLLFVSFNVGFYFRNLIRYAASSDGMIVSCKSVKRGKEEVVAHFEVRVAWQYLETPQVNRS